MSARADPSDGQGATRQSTSPLVRFMAFVAPTGILTGIFYYFGYVSARSFYGYFGISLSTLNLPASHYFIQTTDAVFRPLATLAIISLAVLFAHQLLDSASRRTARLITWELILGSAALATVGLAGLYTGIGGAPSAVSLALAVLFVEYSLWLGLQTSALSGWLTTLAQSKAELRRGILLAIFLVAVFWAITDLAYNRGIQRARIVEETLPIQPQAVVYSAQQLFIPGAGVEMTRLPAAGEDGAAFRYNGLRPLIYANDRWFLLPKGWKRDNGDTVVLLRDAPSQIRVDLAPGLLGVS